MNQGQPCVRIADFGRFILSRKTMGGCLFFFLLFFLFLGTKLLATAKDHFFEGEFVPLVRMALKGNQKEHHHFGGIIVL